MTHRDRAWTAFREPALREHDHFDRYFSARDSDRRHYDRDFYSHSGHNSDDRGGHSFDDRGRGPKDHGRHGYDSRSGRAYGDRTGRGYDRDGAASIEAAATLCMISAMGPRPRP